MINEYVRECKIGTGSYGKVVSCGDHSVFLTSVLNHFHYALGMGYWLNCNRDQLQAPVT
jgi:hypothetical protein